LLLQPPNLGQAAADMLKKKVGDRIQIETNELSVVGIVNGGAWVENSSVILSLSLLQEISGILRQIFDQATRPPQGRARWTSRAMGISHRAAGLASRLKLSLGRSKSRS